MNIIEKNPSIEMRNAFWLSLIALLEGIQALALLAFVFARIPAKSSLADIVYPEWMYRVQPEHEIFLFRSFVLMTILFQAAIFTMFRRRLADASLQKQLRPFALSETLLVALMAAAVFQMTVYAERPQLAQNALAVLGVLAVVNKIFWKQLCAFASAVRHFICDPANRAPVRSLAVVGFGIFIVALIHIPNPEAALARMFMGEQFHHYDSYIMAPGWAHIAGLRLNMDVISQYGVGMPIILSELAKIFGSFNYLSAFKLIVWMTIIYFVMSFIFLRLWLNSALVAMIGILMAIKVHMFHTGIFPFVFTLPSAMVSRYTFDIVLFFLLLYHLRTHRRYLLLAASVVCGLSVFYMTSTGMCLVLAFITYIAAHLITPHLRPHVYKNAKDLRYLAVVGGLVPLSAVLLFWLAVGGDLWTKEFSYNMKEFNQYFLSGFGTMPMYQSLQEHNYLANLMGFWIPAVYAFTMIVVASWIYRRKAPDVHLMAVVLSLYGLTMYHYYIARSAVTSYYVVAIPYVFICCYWLKIMGDLLPSKIKFRLYAGLLVFALYALLTTHNYVAYPNAINISRNPIVDPRIVHFVQPDNVSYFNHVYHKASRLPKEWFTDQDEEIRTEKDFDSDDSLKAFFKTRFDFSKDAALIDNFIKPDEKAAVISSFETKILIDAQRKPYFYYFPLIVSRPMKMHMFATSTLYTVDHYKKTIDQLEKDKPAYIFIEKTFYLVRGLPAGYQPVDAFVPLMYYVLSNYTPYAENGGYLVALKRNDAPNGNLPSGK